MKSVFSKDRLPFSVAAIFLCFLICAATMFVRIECTKIGYEIGKLKKQREKLLDSVYKLEKRLTILTSKKSLIKYSKIEDIENEI